MQETFISLNCVLLSSSSRRLCLCSEKTEAARQHVSELPVF